MYGKRQDALHYAGDVSERAAKIWEILTPDIEGVKSICAVRAQFESVIFRLGKFFAALIFVESSSATSNTGRLNSENEVIVILTVEIRRQTVLSCKTVVDKVVFLLMSHRITERGCYYVPTAFSELVNNSVAEIHGVDGVVRTECGSIVVENHCLTLVMGVILAELSHESRNLPLIFHIERFEDIESAKAFIGLSGHNPVDIGVIVHTDADWSISVKIAVGPAVESFGLKVESESVEVFKITVVILMVLFHGGVETIAGNTDFLAHYRGLKRERCKVTFHVPKVLFAQELDVLNRGIFPVVCGDRAELIDVGVKAAKVAPEIRGRLDALFSQFENLLLLAPLLINAALDCPDDFRIHLFLIFEEP